MPGDNEEITRLKWRMLMKSYYVMFRNIIDRSKLPEALLPHYRWIIELEKQGHVFASGPLFADDNGPGVGMTVFRTSSFEETAALAAQDPFVLSGAATFEIKRWQLNEGRISIQIDLSDQSYSLS